MDLDEPSPPNEHLTFPKFQTSGDASTSKAATSLPPVRNVLNERLYIGNLHPSVDEYTLLKVFSKFGHVNKLDFLFHKAGPLKGKPRGYAFIEYASDDDARKALTSANEKLLRGRKLVVTYANYAPTTDGARSTKSLMDNAKPTTLSMLKSGQSGRNADATTSKIAQMEAKLHQMERTAMPGHPSLILQHPLPMKPSVQASGEAERPRVSVISATRPLPLVPSPPTVLDRKTKPSVSQPPKKAGLAGVKIVKRSKPPEGSQPVD